VSHPLLHELNSELIPQFRSVVAWAYSGEPPTDDDVQIELPGGGKRYVALVEGEGAGVCQVYDLNCTRGSGAMRVGGIGLVGVHPNHRGSGFGQRMMKELLERMAGQGFGMAALYGFRDTYYRKVGFGSAGWKWQFKCAVDRMPVTLSQLPIRQIEPSDWQLLAGCHDKWVERRSMGVRRNEGLWERRFRQAPPGRYAFGDPVEGYAFVKHGGFWGTVDVAEFVFTTRASYETGLAFIRTLAINAHDVMWWEPSDGPGVFRHADYGIEAQRDKGSMFRVVNVKAALESLRPDDQFEGEIVIAVDDPLLESTRGPWHVKWSGGRVAVEPCKRMPNVTIPVPALSQALAGDPSWRLLAREGSLSATDGVLDRLEQLAPAMVVYHSEAY